MRVVEAIATTREAAAVAMAAKVVREEEATPDVTRPGRSAALVEDAKPSFSMTEWRLVEAAALARTTTPKRRRAATVEGSFSRGRPRFRSAAWWARTDRARKPRSTTEQAVAAQEERSISEPKPR
jgi:hypothetical protein